MKIHRGGGASVGVVNCGGLGQKEMGGKENRDGVLLGGKSYHYSNRLPLCLCNLNFGDERLPLLGWLPCGVLKMENLNWNIGIQLP